MENEGGKGSSTDEDLMIIKILSNKLTRQGNFCEVTCCLLSYFVKFSTVDWCTVCYMDWYTDNIFVVSYVLVYKYQQCWYRHIKIIENLNFFYKTIAPTIVKIWVLNIIVTAFVKNTV
jgi:hypothetical protein